MTPAQQLLYASTIAAVALPDSGRASLKRAIARGVADESNAHLYAGWLARFGGNPMTKLLTRLVRSGVPADAEVNWDLIRQLERTDRQFGQHEANFLAYMFQLPPRELRRKDRIDRIEDALRAMIQHDEGLIKVGVLKHFVELDEAKEALKN